MKNRLRPILIATVFAALSSASVPASTFFTNRTDFLNAIASSNYTETFASIPFGNAFSGPTNFSGNGFTFSADNTVPADGLFADQIGSTNVLSLGGATGTGGLNFDFSANTYAVGGYFFVGNPSVLNALVTLDLTLSDAAPINFSTNVSSFDNAFFGWVFSTNQVLSMTVSSTSVEGWASTSELTVAVPEPSTYALLGLAAAGLAAYAVRRRRA